MTREEYQSAIKKANCEAKPWFPVLQIQTDYISSLEAETAKLKDALEKAAKLMEEYTQSCPADMHNWDHTNTCESHCETMNPGDWWKCWLDWLMGAK